MLNLDYARECIDIAKDSIKQAFGSPQLSIFGNDFARWWYNCKYKTKPFSDFLTQVFGERRLLGSVRNNHPKVAVTSCLAEEDRPAVLLTSYNRPKDQNDKSDPFNLLQPTQKFTITDAALATSAATSYFVPHRAGPDLFVDGGCRNNCPAKIGLQEAKRLWPHHNLDFVLSLGTGDFPDEDSDLKSDILSIATAILNFQPSSEDIWKAVEICEPSKSARINPSIRGIAVSLDAADKVEDLIDETNKFLSTPIGKDQVTNVSEKLFALLFYASEMTESSGRVSFRIKSRQALSEKQRSFILSFRMTAASSSNEEQLTEWSGEPAWTTTAKSFFWVANVCGELVVPAGVSRPLKLQCTARIQLDDATERDLPISGFPVLLSDSTP
jgi:hypothetical protein